MKTIVKMTEHKQNNLQWYAKLCDLMRFLCWANVHVHVYVYSLLLTAFRLHNNVVFLYVVGKYHFNIDQEGGKTTLRMMQIKQGKVIYKGQRGHPIGLSWCTKSKRHSGDEWQQSGIVTTTNITWYNRVQ